MYSIIRNSSLYKYLPIPFYNEIDHCTLDEVKHAHKGNKFASIMFSVKHFVYMDGMCAIFTKLHDLYVSKCPVGYFL